MDAKAMSKMFEDAGVSGCKIEVRAAIPPWIKVAIPEEILTPDAKLYWVKVSGQPRKLTKKVRSKNPHTPVGFNNVVVVDEKEGLIGLRYIC